MIFYIIGLILVVYAFKNFKLAFSLYLAYKLLLGPNITVVSVPGIPLLSLELTLTIMFILIYVVRYRKACRARMRFPYIVPFTLLFISWGLSTVFGVAGFMAELSTMVRMVLESMLLVWVIWETMETDEDFEIWYRIVSVVILLTCIYGFIEYVLQDNPILTYEQTLISDPARLTDWSTVNKGRGYMISSFFPHRIGAGINWSMYFVFTFKRWLDSEKEKFPVFYLITAILCIPCILLTRQRTPLLFLAAACLCLVAPKNKRFRILVLIGILCLIASSPLIIANKNIFLSLFDKSAQAAVGGSSISMRITQHLSAIKLAEGSPLVGFGYKFRDVMTDPRIADLKELEGVWIAAIVEYGLIGVIAYAVYAVWSIFVIPRSFASWPLFFMALAYWIAISASSLPGFAEAFYFTILFYFMKSSARYAQEADR